MKNLFKALAFVLWVVHGVATAQTPVWTQFPNSPSGTVRNDDIFFTTYTPNVAVTSDPCTGVGSGVNRSYIVSVFNGAAVIDRNHDDSYTTDERSSDLSQGGIAPETTFLFPASNGTNGDGTQSGGETGGSRGPVVCLQGVEVLNACTNYDRRRKTYWREGTAN